MRSEGPQARAGHKKKARQKSGAPSNKMFGNCLLGFHCSQKDPAGNRAVARFLVVAEHQQQVLSTAYPQRLVDVLGIDFRSAFCCRLRLKAAGARLHSIFLRPESTHKNLCEHLHTY